MVALVPSVRIDYALEVLRSILADGLSTYLPANRIVIGRSIGNPSKARLPRPYAWIQPLTLPAMVQSVTDERVTREIKASYDATIVAATDGREYKLRINGLPAVATATALDTTSTVRDKLLAAVTALGEPVALAAISSAILRVTPSYPGAVYSLTSPTSSVRLTLAATPHVPAQHATYTLGLRSCTVRLQFYSEPSRVGSEGAHLLAGLAYAAIDTPANILRLKDSRVSVLPISPILDTSGIIASEAGGEQRASFDISLSCAALGVHAARLIETVEGILDVSPNGEITWTVD